MSNKARILIIESDENMQFSLLIGMKLDGFEVDIAENGKVALSLASKVKYDLLIYDINQLTETNYLGNLMNLYPRPKMLVISRYPKLYRVISNRYAVEIDTFLLKPFEPQAFLTAVKSLLAF